MFYIETDMPAWAGETHVLQLEATLLWKSKANGLP